MHQRVERGNSTTVEHVACPQMDVSATMAHNNGIRYGNYWFTMGSTGHALQLNKFLGKLDQLWKSIASLKTVTCQKREARTKNRKKN